MSILNCLFKKYRIYTLSTSKFLLGFKLVYPLAYLISNRPLKCNMFKYKQIFFRTTHTSPPKGFPLSNGNSILPGTQTKSLGIILIFSFFSPVSKLYRFLPSEYIQNVITHLHCYLPGPSCHHLIWISAATS